ncbi:hypothetical protein [Deinococcus knuensis]|uniref:Uncharacterized protein n=1 Tax=Deinococcus knuensis TaxID=1837380 RepID=A0ABQ2SVM4_9DEIO|nr:hypothetical protein [Deinococcus knuensis]GGS38231.1 hypothetical protein GCM10008961_32220 [Deinococcus knuensis]
MNNRSVSNVLFVAGAASIIGSIIIWATHGGQAKDEVGKAHGERYGIFVGLWAPTFFILSNRYNTAALEEGL